MGSATIDSLGQLRITLHLYNALKLRDPLLRIPFLEDMDKLFKNMKAVWTGGKPKRGSCCAVFCMSWGISASQAARLAFKHTAIEDTFPEYIGAKDHKRNSNERIHPEDISASYRCLAHHNLRSENKDNRHNTFRNARAAVINSQKKKHCSSMIDPMRDDQDHVFPVNFTAVGSILLEFVKALSDHMGWSNMAEDAVRYDVDASLGNVFSSDLYHKQYYVSLIVRDFLLGFDRNSAEQLLPEFDADRVSAFTKSFFDNLEKERYIFFIEHLSTRN
ncbi:hypothetical protein FisN_10Lu159 [Fistulifera solaris]|uniref:Uncharacterized protein n=1 Tax=Fistulifera solaris TaxID=1519565 RepID=A0A1Z5JTT5_FISSO|nr:hypothetical protein FisN_10Lu159 [Fistulifera solaris]|eukprot:GAX17286.1 hypothetical protein FisN_10Lu159 [Fistulifera solaris]